MTPEKKQAALDAMKQEMLRQVIHEEGNYFDPERTGGLACIDGYYDLRKIIDAIGEVL